MYRRILIVEDEPTLRKLLVRNLASRGHEVLEAATAAEARAQLDRELPDLMLLDVNLPDRSGLDVLRDLQQQGTPVPTIVVSAVRIPRTRLDELKPLAYLPKPFPLEALLRLVSDETEGVKTAPA
jgi:DNA-binding response OmpR family regulator